MKIVVIGTRGIPGIQGGVETHCEELYPRLAAMGHDVTVVRRTPYVGDSNRMAAFKGVKLVDIFAPRRKSLEAIVHTFLAVVKARALKPDILHIHAIGPSVMTPLARMLGMKVVTTNHGPDYDRQKWGRLAKAVLRAGEWAGARFSNKVIVISTTIADILASKYGRRDTVLIYNGVNAPEKRPGNDLLATMGIDRPYVVALGRFVKEKGFHDLVRAFRQSRAYATHQLVIAGDSDHPDSYSESLKQQAKEAGVVLTGFIKGEPLRQVMANASLFAIPSYHEGLPIALLEAMSYGLDVVASDIPANRLDILRKDDFFPAGNVSALADTIDRKLAEGRTPRAFDLGAFDWDKIAAQTAEVYREA